MNRYRHNYYKHTYFNILQDTQGKRLYIATQGNILYS